MLPTSPQQNKCRIINLNTSHPSHWVCYRKNGNDRIFFDPIAQVTPVKVQHYLKTRHEFEKGLSVIQRNAYIVPIAKL